MCGIAWCDFSWDALATLLAGFAALVTGILAVGAAVYVGKLQHKIMLKQQEILYHQTTIERLNLRTTTFDKRWEVYEATANWLSEWARTGQRPRGEVADKFRWALEKSKFLFRPSVSAKLNEWRVLQIRHHYISQKLESDRTTAAERETFEAKAIEIDKALSEAFTEIVTVFGQEMMLSESNAQLPDLPRPDRENPENA